MPPRSSTLLEIALGLLLLGVVSLLFLPASAPLALALVALAAVRHGYLLAAAGFGLVGLVHRRALRALRQRVDELELELADQGVKLLVMLEEKQELEERLAGGRPPDPNP